MERKPDIILKLEKQLGTSISYFPRESHIYELPNNSISYSTDESNNVTLLTLADRNVNPDQLLPFKNVLFLVLRNCNLKDITFLSGFKKLYHLDIAENKIRDISSLRNVNMLRYLNIARNQVFDLSPIFTQLKHPNFESLITFDNPLFYPNIKLAHAGKNAIIEWFENVLQLARYSISICMVNKKTRLDLGNHGLTDISLLPELFDCIHIKELILSNEWGIIQPENSIDKIHTINSGMPNNIFYIPPEIQKLKELEILIVGGDWAKSDDHWNRGRIKNFDTFQHLTKLKYLNISNNLIKGEISLTSLRQLEEFVANNNFIKRVKSHFHLKSLYHINLSNNELRNADFLKKMPKATTIDLHSNQISNLYEAREIVLKKGITDSKWRTNTINIANNPLDIPNMEVIAQGMSAVDGFFQQYEAERSVRIPPYKNDDIKIILAGNSDAGKSSLIERLITGEWNDQLSTTHWMEIKRWQPIRNGRKYNIRLFDFGGQEYYHDTHYLFFSNHTAYILLWDKKTNKFDACEIQQMQKDSTRLNVYIQGFPIPYWLEAITYHTKRKLSSEEATILNLISNSNKSNPPINVNMEGKFSGELRSFESEISIPKELLLNLQGANVLIAQNKIESAEDAAFLNQSAYKDEFPEIYDFTNISVKSGRGMNHFENLLFEMIDTMPISERECLGTWGAIKQEIETGVNEENKVMSLGDFRKYCNHIISGIQEVKHAGIKSTNALYFSIADTESYARYLNDIGLILYFPDNEHLKDKVFLRQNDILKKIYDILEGLHGLNGQFDQDHILKALQKKKFDEECTTIIELMKHFKIAFPHPSQEGSFIAPLYLPAQPSKSISIFLDDGHQPSYRFLFQGFIHKHIILEFFHLYGQQALRDEHGQQYYYWKNGIVIKDELTQGIVMVRFINATATAKAFIDVYSLGKNGDKSLLTKITGELERLTFDMNVKKAVTANGTDFVPVDVIHAAEASNQWIFHFNDQYFDLKQFRDHLNTKLKMKKIFISYSKTDAHYLQQLENHLSALKRNGSISTWNCRQLLPGEKWDGKIKKELEEADIIMFLVSSDFLATDYIWDIEIKRAIEREKENPDAVKVVPLMLRSCAWEDTPLSAFNTALKKAQVIALAPDIDEAFTEVVKDIKKIL